MTSPLVKIAPVTEEKISDFSPFLTTMDELKAAANTDQTLADSLGLPLISEDAKYKIYDITPLRPSEVFVNEIAPTTEFGGNIARTGGVRNFWCQTGRNGPPQSSLAKLTIRNHYGYHPSQTSSQAAT